MLDKVEVRIGRKGLSYSNILWKPAHPMRGGNFPQSHPCYDNPNPTVFSFDEQPSTDDSLGKFRARGYFASCFPEGDGITFESINERHSPLKICNDVKECFGVTVSNYRAVLEEEKRFNAQQSIAGSEDSTQTAQNQRCVCPSCGASHTYANGKSISGAASAMH